MLLSTTGTPGVSNTDWEVGGVHGHEIRVDQNPDQVKDPSVSNACWNSASMVGGLNGYRPSDLATVVIALAALPQPA